MSVRRGAPVFLAFTTRPLLLATAPELAELAPAELVELATIMEALPPWLARQVASTGLPAPNAAMVLDHHMPAGSARTTLGFQSMQRLRHTLCHAIVFDSSKSLTQTTHATRSCTCARRPSCRATSRASVNDSSVRSSCCLRIFGHPLRSPHAFFKTSNNRVLASGPWPPQGL